MVKSSSVKCFRRSINSSVKIFRRLNVSSRSKNFVELFTAKVPHHGVIRDDKETSKLRIVFDASSKLSGPSLNDCLYKGPQLTPLLFEIMLKFRIFPIALIADIEKAYHQISIYEGERDYLRFLWFKDAFADEPVIERNRFARVIFGMNSSQFLLNSTLEKHTYQFIAEDPEFVQKVINSFYVDDFSNGEYDIEKAFNLYKKLKIRFLDGKFNLRKWKTNNQDLRKLINVAENIDTEPEVNYPNITKHLGVTWDQDNDNLLFEFKDICENALTMKVTKRNVLKTLASFYDPIGLIQPIILVLKLIFQRICESSVDWDDPVPTDLSSEWVAVIDRLNQLGYLSINRCYMTTMLTDPFVIYELHGFSDASLKAYGACVYLRGITRSGLVKTCLVSSKSRVAPRKVLTIPRLELLGNLILARLVVSIAPVLRKELYLNEIFYWTDSMITLAWIKSLDKEYKTFVENRIQEIRKLTDSNKWKYCCTTENPADIITRQDISLTSCQKQLWWEGPEHLKLLNDQWAEISCNLHGDQLIMSENEEKSHVVTLTSREQTDVSIANTISIENYSNIRKLYRVTAWVKRFINNVRSSLSRCVVNASQVLSCEEMSKAENAWIMENQRHLNKSSRYHQLESESNVFNDDCGIIRCKGRLSQAPIPDSAKFPVLLARNHRLAELIVIRTHVMLKHSGVKQTLTEIRQKYWIPKGRSYIRKLLFNCVTCRRLQGKHYDYPILDLFLPLV